MFHYFSIKIFRSLFFVFAFSVVCLSGSSPASAATYEITGWGWAADSNISQGLCDNIPSNGIPDCIPNGLGWVSFSNKSEQTAIPYGVRFDSFTGNISGYAWSPNLGWITYNESNMKLCSTNPGDSCPPGPAPRAHISVLTDANGLIVGGSGVVTGWARACAVFANGCSGALRGDSQTGGWDGWISLSGTGYGLQLDTTGAGGVMKFKGPVTTGFFTGTPLCGTCYAWGGGDNKTGFGWGFNFGGLNVSLIPSSVSAYLSFWADQTTIGSGQTATLRWLAGGAVDHCTAGGSWSGNKLFGTPQSFVTGVLTTSQSYTLQCFGPNSASSADDSPLRTVNIAVVSPVLQNGACGSAAGGKTRIKPVFELCSVGSLVDPPGVVEQPTARTWSWTCSGVNGGVQSPLCVSYKAKNVPFVREN